MRFHAAWMPLALLVFPAKVQNAWALGDTPLYSRVEQVDGAPTVTVKSPNGTSREARAGDALQAGDTISTTPNEAVRISFDNLSQVMISDDAEVSVSEEIGNVTDQKLSTPAVEVRKGDVRVMVEPAPAPAAAPSEAPVPPAPPSGAPQAETKPAHKFFIRTPTATMGVRGTDFVVALGESGTGLYTLEGTVDIGDSIKNLRSGTGSTPVSKGQGVNASPGHDALAAVPFNQEEFLKIFHKKHPKLEALAAGARAAILSGALKARYDAEREARAEAIEAPSGHASGSDVVTFGGKKKTVKKVKKP